MLWFVLLRILSLSFKGEKHPSSVNREGYREMLATVLEDTESELSCKSFGLMLLCICKACPSGLTY